MSPGKPEQSRWSRALLRRPAVTAAAVFIGGIALHDWFVPRPLIFTATAIAACVFAIVFFRRAFFSSIALAIGIFCAGVAALKHLGSIGREASRHMRRVDTATMTPEEKAEFYREMGVFHAAVTDFEHAKQLRPVFVPARIHLGVTLYSLG